MRYLTDRREGGAPRSAFAACKRAVRDLRRQAVQHRSPNGRILRSPATPGDRDYHDVLREGLERMVERLCVRSSAFEWKICVDTAPLLERTYARLAGLGWIGKNTCLIHEPLGSWFFLGEMITSLELAPDSPPPDRCGSCTRCIEACPTQALVPDLNQGADSWTLDSRRCISYLTIELRGPIPEELRAGSRRARLRLRHLPGSVPVEFARAGEPRDRVRSAGDSGAGGPGANDRGRVSRVRARHSAQPAEIRGVSRNAAAALEQKAGTVHSYPIFRRS